MAARELEVVESRDDAAAAGEVLDAEPLHVLTLGDKKFVCRDDARVTSLFFRYADDVVRLYHEMLIRAVDPADHDAAWDAFEEVGIDAGTDALAALVATYAERPTKRP